MTDKEMSERITLQNKEFDAADDLAKAYRDITMTMVVDDDYPAVRHAYEGAVRVFLQACAKNGRRL